MKLSWRKVWRKKQKKSKWNQLNSIDRNFKRSTIAIFIANLFKKKFLLIPNPKNHLQTISKPNFLKMSSSPLGFVILATLLLEPLKKKSSNSKTSVIIQLKWHLILKFWRQLITKSLLKRVNWRQENKFQSMSHWQPKRTRSSESCFLQLFWKLRMEPNTKLNWSATWLFLKFKSIPIQRELLTLKKSYVDREK